MSMQKRFSPEAEEILENIRNTAAKGQMECIPNLLIVSDTGAGFSEYSRRIEEILNQYKAFSMRGEKTYFEVTFPPIEASERDFRKFMQSGNAVALFQNEYSGVEVISFEEYLGKDIFGPRFDILLNYIDKAKERTFFIFKVNQAFKAKNELFGRLNNHINLLQLSLEQPGSYEAVNYIITRLKEQGFEFTFKAREALEEVILSRLEHSKETYRGYHTLNLLSQSIAYELITSGFINNKKITINAVRQISNKVFTPFITKKNRPIGF